MSVVDAIRGKLAELAPRTVSHHGVRGRRDPATRAKSLDRIASLPEDAKTLELRPTWFASLWRRRYVKKRSGNRVVKVPIPDRKTVPTAKIIGLHYRPARWWWPGLLAIEVETGHGDPWRWTSLDGTWRLRWRNGTTAATEVTMLWLRLDWTFRALQARREKRLR